MAKSNVSAADLTHQLRGIDFPARKKDLVKHARDNNADDAVIRELESMPDQEFRSMRDLAQAMKQVGSQGQSSSRGGSTEED